MSFDLSEKKKPRVRKRHYIVEVLALFAFLTPILIHSLLQIGFSPVLTTSMEPRYMPGDLQIRHPIPDHVRLSDPLNVGVYCEGELIGVIGLKDPIRKESKEFIARLRELGVRSIAMLTGDKYATAQVVAEELGITEVFAELTPEHKMKITQEYLDRTSPQRKTVVLVGDGVNDAPALVLADVGVAMGARGSTAASEAADMVIVEDSIDRLTQSIEIAQNSRRRALQAAGAGIALSVAGMACGAFGIMSVSVGAIAQECIDVLAIVWALTALRD